MSKFVKLILITALIALTWAMPKTEVFGNNIEGKDAVIESESFTIDPQGNYEFSYKQTDLQERQERGEVAINPETGNNTLDNVVGSYKYVRPDGLWQIVEYRADGNGFAPIVKTEPYEETGTL